MVTLWYMMLGLCRSGLFRQVATPLCVSGLCKWGKWIHCLSAMSIKFHLILIKNGCSGRYSHVAVSRVKISRGFTTCVVWKTCFYLELLKKIECQFDMFKPTISFIMFYLSMILRKIESNLFSYIYLKSWINKSLKHNKKINGMPILAQVTCCCMSIRTIR